MDLAQAIETGTFAPRRIWYVEACDSTNRVAMDALRGDDFTHQVFVTNQQTSGRGRLGRVWSAEAGDAILASVLVDEVTVEQLGAVTMWGAVAVLEGIVSTASLHSLALGSGEKNSIGLKWPNDVQVNGKKVCGILAEACWQGDRLKGAVLGLGVNVRGDFAGMALADTATSLEKEWGVPLRRAEVLACILERLEAWRTKLGTAELWETWRGYLTTIGQPVRVMQAGGIISGLAEAVDSRGALWIRDEAGILHAALVGDIAVGHG